MVVQKIKRTLDWRTLMPTILALAVMMAGLWWWTIEEERRDFLAREESSKSFAEAKVDAVKTREEVRFVSEIIKAHLQIDCHGKVCEDIRALQTEIEYLKRREREAQNK